MPGLDGDDPAPRTAYLDRLGRAQRDGLLRFLMGYLSGAGRLASVLGSAEAAGVIPPAHPPIPQRGHTP